MIKTTAILLFFLFLSAAYSGTGLNSKLKTAVINTYGMHCTGCEETIEAEIKKLDGVKFVKADHVNEKIIVKYNNSKTNLHSIKEAIVTAGYRLKD